MGFFNEEARIKYFENTLQIDRNLQLLTDIHRQEEIDELKKENKRLKKIIKKSKKGGEKSEEES